MSKSLIGIDINCMEVGMVNANAQMHVEALPENVVDNLGVISPESAIFPEFIARMKKNCGIKGNDVALVLPEKTAYYKTIESPVMSDDQIKLNLPYEFRNYVGNEPQNYWYDYYVDEIVNDEDGNPASLRIVAAAALKEPVDNLGNCLKRGGYNLALALPREVCLINIMKKADLGDKECCLVGVDYENTSIYIFKGGKLEATKVVDLGAREIDIALANEYKIDERLASTYRASNYDNCLAKPSLVDFYDRIALEVMKTINFYRYEHSESKVDTAYFFDQCAGNNDLNDAICKQAGFKKGDINDILPAAYKDVEGIAKELYAIGVIL